ncbi:MarR family winged helix-turn-helix transcriptional regulator [Nocardia huaxiensis]|uniref:MarR family transcriptional regulator n=1 Tax=Nocardia huaxiensis TaxID=2755382 RepID=A0A7D6VII8_9NOCA|nr:MarR family transcriptional regulator [Nocardia huaxiensis]QLY33717.1 MarR family transcriptional regulator [Nocardia huaxiensis]UFS99360.1 MarR family transcriptional regulator [Nocardia huaxiensis]
MEFAHTGASGRLRALPTRLVGQVALIAHRATDKALADTGSRRYHYAILATLDEAGPLSQAEVGRRTGIDRSDIVAAVNDLSTRGLAARTPDPTDRRRNILTLTAAGHTHLDDLDARLESAQSEFLPGFSPAERATLVLTLTRILDAHTP